MKLSVKFYSGKIRFGAIIGLLIGAVCMRRCVARACDGRWRE